MKARVGVVMGGMSAEREVSFSSGRAVAEALRSLGHDVVEVEWNDTLGCLEALRDNPIDAAFLALHGRFGEDGCIQGLLEMLGVPYTGSSVLASALAMDKVKSKELFRLFNVPTPPYYVLDAGVPLEALAERHGSFGFPVVVKPRREGSSIGVTKALDLQAFRRGVQHAREFDQDVLVERYVAGREVHVGLLDGRVLGAIEVAPDNGMYDFEAKYTPGRTQYFMPARLPATRYRGILNLAERAAQALGVTGAARVDLLVTEGENEYVLEVNSLPGMTPTSLLPKIAESAGYDFAHLCDEILARARLHNGIAESHPASAVVEHVDEASFDLDELAVARTTQRRVAARQAV
ncbi:MAG TPA: D-alanine--D-alanine ligase [Polyangiaceae bacterium]